MSPKQIKAIQLANRIQKLIFSYLDDNNFHKALGHNLDRYNAVKLSVYPGMKELTPGQMLDEWHETRVFESKL